MALSVEFNDDGSITVNGPITDPEAVAAIRAYADKHGVTEQEAVKVLLVAGAKEIIRQRSIPDGGHRAHGQAR